MFLVLYHLTSINVLNLPEASLRGPRFADRPGFHACRDLRTARAPGWSQRSRRLHGMRQAVLDKWFPLMPFAISINFVSVMFIATIYYYIDAFRGSEDWEHVVLRRLSTDLLLSLSRCPLQNRTNSLNGGVGGGVCLCGPKE